MLFKKLSIQVSFKINAALWSLFILLPLCSNALNKDTILNTVYSKPFFYNVLKDEKGAIYAGTSEGLFLMEGTNPMKINKKPGYISLSSAGEKVVDPGGIKNYHENKYAYLLPYPELIRDEYHAATDDYFYLCSGGRLYIFDIVPYSYSYPNHSVRTISEHFVGTYSGIYLNGTKLGSPVREFTDGYIREYDGRAFICYDWILILEPPAVRSGVIDSIAKDAHRIDCAEGVQFRDIYSSSFSSNFFLSSLTHLFIMPKSIDVARPIYKSAGKGDLSIIGENKHFLYFTDSNYVLRISMDASTIDTIAKTPDPILDGSINNRNIFLLTGNGIYVINTDNSINKLASVAQAHTMELISGTEMIISTDNGLFRFNTVNRKLSTLIPGVEFNRRALLIKDNMIQAGSINGLYSIDISDLDILVQKNEPAFKQRSLPDYVIAIIVFALFSLVLLAFLLLRLQKKLAAAETQIEELNENTLDLEKLEQYIRENLSIASLKSIKDHFNTNNSFIYKLIEPEKPGTIIQKMRLDKVIEMRNEGKNVSEIAEVTGLSEAHIKKIVPKLDFP